MRAAERVFCTVMAAALVCATASAQFDDGRRRQPAVEFAARSFQYNASRDMWEAHGACEVTMRVRGEYEGTMQSEALRIMRAHNRAHEIMALGPVTLKITMTRHRHVARRPLTSGLAGEQDDQQVEISVACTGEAVVDTKEETIVLRGRATAQVRSLGQGQAERVAGDSIGLNLKTRQITVTRAILDLAPEE